MPECEPGVAPITREKGAADVTAWWSRDHRHPLDRHIFGSDDNHRHCHSCTDVDDRDVVLMKRSFWFMHFLFCIKSYCETVEGWPLTTLAAGAGTWWTFGDPGTPQELDDGLRVARWGTSTPKSCPQNWGRIYWHGRLSRSVMWLDT